MKRFCIRQTVLVMALACGLVAWSGCAKAPMPSVQNFDSYENVAMGPLSYTTAQGMRVTESDHGYVIHEWDKAPGARLQVALKTDPPRRFKDDADLERRRFQRAIPNGRWTAAQYYEVDGRETMRVNIHGVEKDGEPVFGVLRIVRFEGDTAVVSAIGPTKYRGEIQRATTLVADSLKF